MRFTIKSVGLSLITLTIFNSKDLSAEYNAPIDLPLSNQNLAAVQDMYSKLKA